MKYGTLFLLLLLAASGSYGQCSEVDRLLKQGDTYLKASRPNYLEAINAYTAAIIACSERAGEARQRISQMVSNINTLRNKAVESEKKADAERVKADAERLKAEQALADLRAQTVSVFESFASLGARLLYTLDYDQALENMRVAAGIEVPIGLKQQRLAGPIAELLYVYAEGGRRPAQARTAASLLLALTPDSSLARTLRQSAAEGWRRRAQFAPLLEQLPSFSLLQARYYPSMISVPLGTDGTFQMGSPASDPDHQSDERQHPVKLSPYQMAATPVTFYQFALFCEAEGKSLASRTPYWGRYGDHPAVNVSWYDAVEYANWLNARQGLPPVYRLVKETGSDPNNQSNLDYLKWRADWSLSAKGYRLPTEAEWELAARGGAGAPYTRFAGSDSLAEVGWYWENSGDQPLSGTWDFNKVLDNNGRTHPVQQKRSNSIGLYDMSGNVFEWCADWYGEGYYDACYRAGTAANPRGPAAGSYRVIRGGSWDYVAAYCRTAYRFRDTPYYRNNGVGFRLVFVP